jgi:hypothetical protein
MIFFFLWRYDPARILLQAFGNPTENQQIFTSKGSTCPHTVNAGLLIFAGKTAGYRVVTGDEAGSKSRELQGKP